MTKTKADYVLVPSPEAAALIREELTARKRPDENARRTVDHETFRRDGMREPDQAERDEIRAALAKSSFDDDRRSDG